MLCYRFYKVFRTGIISLGCANNLLGQAVLKEYHRSRNPSSMATNVSEKTWFPTSQPTCSTYTKSTLFSFVQWSPWARPTCNPFTAMFECYDHSLAFSTRSYSALLHHLQANSVRMSLALHELTANKIDSLQLNCARIHIMAYHFFAHPTHPGPDADGLSRFYSLCISVIQTTVAMTMSQPAASSAVSQSFIDRTITLAGFSILRLVRSSLAQHLDLAAGEQAFFQAVQFLKGVSLQQGDIGIRTALIMRDLRSSNRVFRRKDGRVEPLALRLRTRLSMSVSYDMFWYWREEFSNMQNPYNGEEATLPSNDTNHNPTPRKLSIPLVEFIADEQAKHIRRNPCRSFQTPQ